MSIILSKLANEFEPLLFVHSNNTDSIIKIDARELSFEALVEPKNDVGLDWILERVASRRDFARLDVEEAVRRESRRAMPGGSSLGRHVGTVLEPAVIEYSRGKNRNLGVHSVLDAE